MQEFIDLSILLYYADYLAIRNKSRQVTDNCKYFYVCDVPMNVAFICNSKPFYDEEDEYYIRAHEEIEAIKNRVGEEKLKKFINAICNIAVMGYVDAKTMLDLAHLFSTFIDRNTAFNDYNRWLKTQHYTHMQCNDIGDMERVECTRYIAHSEYNSDKLPQVEYWGTPTKVQKYDNKKV